MLCPECDTCKTRRVVGASMRRDFSATPPPYQPAGGLWVIIRAYWTGWPICLHCGDSMKVHGAAPAHT